MNTLEDFLFYSKNLNLLDIFYDENIFTIKDLKENIQILNSLVIKYKYFLLI